MSLTKVTYSMINGAPVNVLDFGADPTGVQDSTVAIQAALDSGAKEVVISQGTYIYSDDINIPIGVNFIGIGYPTLKLTVDQYKIIFALGSNIIDGIIFDGNQTVFGGIDFTLYSNFALSGENFSVTRCKFINGGGSGVSGISASKIRISDCVFNQFGDHEIYFSTSCSEIIIENNSLSKTTGNECIKFRTSDSGTGIQDIVISNNTFDVPNKVAIFFQSAGTSGSAQSIERISVANNVGVCGVAFVNFTTSTGNAFTSDVSITGNSIEGGGANLSFNGKGASNIVVSSNFFKNASLGAISGAVGAEVTDITISNNIFIEPTLTVSAIAIGPYAKRVIIDGNIFNGTGAKTRHLDVYNDVDFEFNNNIVKTSSVFFASLNSSANVVGSFVGNKIGTLSRNMLTGDSVTGTSKIFIDSNTVDGDNVSFPGMFSLSDAAFPFFQIGVNNTGGVVVNSIKSAAPTTGTFQQGAIVYNSSPTAAGFIGFVCVTAGTPGTWKTFGAISA